MYRLSEVKIRNALDKAFEVLMDVGLLNEIPEIAEIIITNATSYWAKIHRYRDLVTRKPFYSLRVSAALFNRIPEDRNPQQCLEETMIHEITHTLPNCYNHGYYFKRAAMYVGIKYPQYSITRTTSMSERGFQAPIKTRVIKYIIQCSVCGAQSKYQKRPRYLNQLDECMCGRCKAPGKYLKVIQSPISKVC